MALPHVRFREGQLLRSTDLVAEQQCRIASRMRHLLTHHGCGIVSGLDVHARDDGAHISPGIAVQQDGTSLTLDNGLLLPLDRFTEEPDVWWAFWLTLPDTHSSYSECGANGADWVAAEVSVTRHEDLSSLDTGDALKSPLACRSTIGQPAPVYLGAVTYVSEEGRLQRSLAGRTYVRSVGSTLRSPTGEMELQLAGERLDDQNRLILRRIDPESGPTDYLTIEPGGRSRLHGPIKISAHPSWSNARLNRPRDLIINDSGGTLLPSLRFAHPMDAPSSANPWSLTLTGTRQDDLVSSQFRIELPNPGKQGNGAAIGASFGRTGSNRSRRLVFDSCVTVHANGNTRIRGNLTVEGRVIQAPVEADPKDPRFAQELIEAQFTMLFSSLFALGEIEPTLRIRRDPSADDAGSGFPVKVDLPNDTYASSVLALFRVTSGSSILPLDTSNALSFSVELPRPRADEAIRIYVVALALATDGTILCGANRFDVSPEPDIG